MSKVEEQDESDEIKRQMALEGVTVKKEYDRPGKLWVSGVPKDANYTNERLKKEFAAFGEVIEVNIICKKSTQIPKGFAFVTFKNPADAETAAKELEGKDIGGENPITCQRAVIGFIKQSQIASSIKRARLGGVGGPRMERGRGGGRGQPLLERGGGFRGMRGGGPPRGGGGRGGGYGGGGERYFQGEEDYYGGGGGEFWEEEGYGEGYSEMGPGGPRGHPPQRGPMRGGPPSMRGRGAPPAAVSRGGYPGRGGARGAAMSEHGGPTRRPLLPSPPVRGGRGASRGRGYPPPPPREEYYAEEEAGYGEEYGAGEEYYEEDPYSNGAGYGEEEQQYEEGYYGIPEAAPRGRGAAAPPGAPRGRNGPGGPQGYRGAELAPTRGGGLSARGNGPVSRGSAPRGAAGGRGGGPVRGAPPESGRRPPSQDPYGYPVEQAAGPPRQRPAHHQASGYGEEYYGEEEVAPKDPYGRPRAAAAASGGGGGGRGPAPSRGAPARRAGDPYAEDPYGVYEGGDGGAYDEEAAYGEGYGGGYVGAPSGGRRGAAPQGRSSAPSRSHSGAGESGRYVDISEYIGQGSGGGGSRYQDEYERQASGREMDSRRPGRSRREEPYMERRVAAETDAYVSYPTSSRMGSEHRESRDRKRHMDPYGPEGDHYPRGYEEYRGIGTPVKRERMDRSVYEAYSSRQEGAYRGL